ncbi:MAG: phenylalanine--tRNA ligase subunit beta [Candidatus Syntrophonatronum acetioxidans]|uniref:Phenylalanine--tRNA ligase beta subunit n=1 Tax=Candidatus Syntrophonatronum acetioxidans TaxID=1795816 RepID=A0A424YGU3_9FIRM|nr:MAG: phenylalanine--tRNA ligase subunit beta [Candidatus Syntrophonatronum acetioxidans]
MLVSYQWLKDYVYTDISPQELAEKLTMSGVEVEALTPFYPDVPNIVVGKVQSVEKHPQADKLYVVQVDVKEEVLQVVVGIANYQEGDLVPVAKPGAVLPKGLKIKKTKLRGIESYGMLCSAEELDLDFRHDYGILILEDSLPVGGNIKEALGLEDWVLELGLTPNRSDCLGMLGLAREISAITGAPLKSDFPQVQEGEERIEEIARVQIIDEDLCPRYSARLVRDIKLEHSPLWFQRRLLAVGIRPINNIVDITNYVMWESGQPLHAFDYDRVSESTVIIRKAYEGEKMTTLDEQERQLEENMLVIADPGGAIALAGVMGGFHTEITGDTKNVLLESANFDPASIRKTSRDLGLRSEASLRFERNVDPNGTLYALDRAAQLIAQLAGGKVVKGVIDEYPSVKENALVDFKPERAQKIIGLDLPASTMKNIFLRLGFKVEGDDSLLKVEVPTRRPDISREEDLVEEVARVYGYEHIKTTLPRGEITQGKKTREQKLTDKAREIITACGLNEAITYSFVSPKIFDQLKLEEDNPLREVIEMHNPLSEEQRIMRTTLLANLLRVLQYNANRSIYNQGVFELGRVFIPRGKLSEKSLPWERETLALALMGEWGEKNWQQKPLSVDFFLLKGILENLLEGLGISNYLIKPCSFSTFHPTRCAELVVGEERIGVLGEVHGEVAASFDLEDRVYMAEVDFESLVKHSSLKIEFEPLPRYPAVLRDIAILVKEDILAEDIRQEILRSGGDLVEDIVLFDLYQGEQISEGYRSLAYSIVYRSPDKTLTDEEVNKVHQRIIDSLEKNFEARLRK